MSSRPRLYLLDVFAERMLEGNQLALVAGDTELAPEFMQRFAAEMNFSETAFLRTTPRADGAFAMRCFTPTHEVQFVGHPLVGAGWALRHLLRVRADDGLRLALPAAVVPVTFESGPSGCEQVWFEAPAIRLGFGPDLGIVAAALGLPEADLVEDPGPCVAGAGTSAILARLRSAEVLARLRPDESGFARLEAEGLPPLVYAFATGGKAQEPILQARFFFRSGDRVREDAASGNAAAFVGAWWMATQEHASTRARRLRIEQGRWLGRASVLHVRCCRGSRGRLRLQVGGNVCLVALGSLI